MYGIEATGQTSSAKVSYHIRLATPVLFPVSLSSVYTDVILSNRNAEESHVTITRAFIPAKPAPQLRNSDGSITLKYPEIDLFGFSVAPLLFVGITIIVSASQFCAYSTKMTNTFWHRSGLGSTSTVIFTISPSECIAGKTDATLGMTFFAVTSAILSGGTIITMYPTNFFAVSVAHVVSAGATSVPGLNIARGAAISTAVVLTTSGATINASAAAFIIRKPASRSNVVFLTGISLSLLVAGFCAQFISLPRVALRLSAMVYLTVRAPFSA